MKMTAEFNISNNRRVLVKKEGNDYFITINEVGSDVKTVTLSGRQFAQLVSFEALIDQSVNRLLVKQNVDFQTNLGGGFFASVQTGYNLVHIRSYYFCKFRGIPRPSKVGVALKLDEWSKLKEIFKEIMIKFPGLKRIVPCSAQPDHFTLEGFLSCDECQPFRQEQELFLQKAQPSYT
jgi:hypothetical protein